MSVTHGVHHVSAMAGDAQRNVEFYAGVLGLRLVKRTVNFDDPMHYHLYYGDASGSPGTLLTFFPYDHAKLGRAGVGQVAVVSLAIAPTSLGYWLQRFVTRGVIHEALGKRFGETVISFRDPDGLQLELVASEVAPHRTAWPSASVPEEHAIRGIAGVTLWEHTLDDTARVLEEELHYTRTASEENTTRFVTGEGAARSVVDVRVVGGFLAGIAGAGTVHHVAFRAGDDATEVAMREQVIAMGMHPTSVIDRQYFRSVYFREPGGVLFELATDAPGFTVDEPFSSLGTTLKLPPQYESMRDKIEQALAPLHDPSGTEPRTLFGVEVTS